MTEFKNLSTRYPVSTIRNKPCLYERGGGYTNTGAVRLIADSCCCPKTPLHVRTGGDRACSDHAAIPVEVGDFVVEVDRHHDDITVSIGQVSGIDEDTVTVSGSRWNIISLFDMVSAAIDKSYDYHCRTPYYIKQGRR